MWKAEREASWQGPAQEPGRRTARGPAATSGCVGRSGSGCLSVCGNPGSTAHGSEGVTRQGHVCPAVLRTASGGSSRSGPSGKGRADLCFQNVTANHRANDVIAAEDGPQVLVGRFMYGPLDMVALTGEKVRGPGRVVGRSRAGRVSGGEGPKSVRPRAGRGGRGAAECPPAPACSPRPSGRPLAPHRVQVDILVMAEPSSGRWVHLDTEITNSSGRITYSVPRPRRLGVGVYPVKMVVR